MPLVFFDHLIHKKVKLNCKSGIMSNLRFVFLCPSTRQGCGVVLTDNTEVRQWPHDGDMRHQRFPQHAEGSVGSCSDASGLAGSTVLDPH